MPGFAWRRDKCQVMPTARKCPSGVVERNTRWCSSPECPSGVVERNTRLVFESGRSIAPESLDSPGVRHSEHPLAR
jgi:hypothetical protein